MTNKIKKYIIFLHCCIPLGLIGQSADTTLFVKQIDSLIKLSRDLTAKRDFDKALEINSTAEKIALEKLGLESAGYASTVFNHGRVLHFKSDYSESEKWYLKSLDIREKLFGKEHPDYASSLHNL
ncbi:MAG: tetratricopeptide repeat protein, partial [Saprospiraceae bacterium]